MDRFDEMKDKVLTVQEVSAYLRVHPSTIYRMLKKNLLPAFRVGSDWRFTVEAIDKWRASVESGVRTRATTTPSESAESADVRE